MDASTVKKAFEDMEAQWKKDEEYRKKEFEKSDALGEGLVVGKVFNTQVADGYAWYEIVKIRARTVVIKCRPDLSPDRWKDAVLSDGGSFPINTIARLVSFRDGMKKLFAKK